MNNPEEQWKKNFQEKLSDYKKPGTGMAWADIERKVIAAKRKRMAVYWLGAASIAAALAIFFVSIFNPAEPRQYEDEKLLTSSQKIEKSYLPDTSEIVTVLKEEQKAGSKRSALSQRLTAQLFPADHGMDLEEKESGKQVEEKEYGRKIEEETVKEKQPVQTKNDETEKVHAADPDWTEIPETPSRKVRINAALYAGAPMGMSTSSNYSAPRLMSAPLFKPQNTDLPESHRKPVLNNANSMNTYEKHYQPVRYGAAVNFGMTERFSIGTGLYFSVLKSKFGYNYNESDGNETLQTLCYLGIPVNATYRFVSLGPVYAYSSIGIMTEWMVYGDRVTRTKPYGDNETEVIGKHPFQFSANAALGLGLHITNGFSFYAEPGVSYYFKNNSDIKSFYHDRNVSFNLNIGFRVDL